MQKGTGVEQRRTRSEGTDHGLGRETLLSASKDQLSLVLSFFPRVDAKLSVVLAIDTGVLAVLGADSPPLRNLTGSMIAPAVLAVLLLAGSIVFLYRGAFPNLEGGGHSLVFFREIARRTEHKFIEEFKHQNGDEHANDVLGQVWRNSQILTAKFAALKAAFILLAVAIAPWLAALLAFAVYNNPARSTLFH